MELEINGQKYVTQKLDVFDQDFVARTIAPVVLKLGSLATLFSIVKSGSGLDTSMESLIPLAEAFRDLPSKDARMIYEKCLSVSYRVMPAGRVQVWNKDAGRMQFDSDNELMVMYRLTWCVISESLGNFIPGLPSSLTVTAARP